MSGTSATPAGRYAFAGTGVGAFGTVGAGGMCSLLTCGLGVLLGIPQALFRRWRIHNATRDGVPFVFGSSLGEAIGHAIVNVLLYFFTCGIALPWIVARSERYEVEHTRTAEGYPQRFDGGGTEILLLAFVSLFVIISTLGLAWPVVAVLYLRWKREHTIVLDPRAPGGWYRLRFDAGPLSYVVPGTLSLLLCGLTLGCYYPWASADFQSFAWSSTSDTLSPRLAVPAGPRTPAQWAVAAGAGLGVLAVSGICLAFAVALGSLTTRGSYAATPRSDLNAGSPAHHASPSSFHEGQRVSALWHNGRRYRGHITARHGDTYTVSFDDGDARRGTRVEMDLRAELGSSSAGGGGSFGGGSFGGGSFGGRSPTGGSPTGGSPTGASVARPSTPPTSAHSVTALRPLCVGTLAPDEVAASRELSEGRSRYPARNAFDCSYDRAWAVRDAAPGVEWLEARFEQPVRIERIWLTTGFEKHHRISGDLFVANAHVRRLSILADGALHATRDVAQHERAIEVAGPPQPVRRLRLRFDAAWPGVRWQDLSISEVQLYGSPAGGGRSFYLGQRVSALWHNGRRYPGRVTRRDGETYTVTFDDGDVRSGGRNTLGIRAQ